MEVLLSFLGGRVFRGFRRQPGGRTERLSDADIHRRLAGWLDDSASLLVLWTRSHRGSRWSGLEVGLFESLHPTRPIFVVRLDDAPWARPSPQWIEVATALDVSGEAVRASTASAGAEIEGGPDLLDALRRPGRWTLAARRLRSGTGVPELLALRARAGALRSRGIPSEGSRAVLRSALASGSTAFLMTLAIAPRRCTARGIVGGRAPHLCCSACH